MVQRTPAHAGLMQEGAPLTVIAHAEITKEELDVEAGVKKTLGNQGRLHLVWGNTLYEKDQLPFRPDASDLPDVFTPFRNKAGHTNFMFLSAGGLSKGSIWQACTLAA